VGPGLVANLILKDQWGRPRPKHVAEFGGSKTFHPPILMSKQCPRNCSFVSGEASAMYIPFFAAAAMLPASAPVLVATGTVMGLAAGAVRIAQGGHFLSDVIFAGVFMALTVLAVRWLMFCPAFLPALRRRLSTGGGAP
jgi:lipid A 4'-phosphatase